VYAIAGNAPVLQDGVLVNYKKSVVSESKDVRFARFIPAADVSMVCTTVEKHADII